MTCALSKFDTWPDLLGAFIHLQDAATDDPFERFVAALRKEATLSAATALLARLEARLPARVAANAGDSVSPDDAVAAGLAALFPKSSATGRRLARYPVRVFLSAYMIQVRGALDRGWPVGHRNCHTISQPHAAAPSSRWRGSVVELFSLCGMATKRLLRLMLLDKDSLQRVLGLCYCVS